MRITVDTRDPRLSPTERLTISNLARKLKPAVRVPTPSGCSESVDEALGKPNG
jgi:hypothetical protein